LVGWIWLVVAGENNIATAAKTQMTRSPKTFTLFPTGTAIGAAVLAIAEPHTGDVLVKLWTHRKRSTMLRGAA
jgi:hypothetical protein